MIIPLPYCVPFFSVLFRRIWKQEKKEVLFKKPAVLYAHHQATGKAFMGAKGSKDVDRRPDDGIAPHDVLCEVGGHEVHYMDATSYALNTRVARIEHDVQKQREKVDKMRGKEPKKRVVSSDPTRDIEEGGSQVPPSSVRSDKPYPQFVPKHGYVALPTDSTGPVMAVHSREGKWEDCLFIPSAAEVPIEPRPQSAQQGSFLGTTTWHKRRQSIISTQSGMSAGTGLNEQRLQYVQQDLRLKRAAMESGIYEVAGVRPLRLYAHDNPEKMQHTLLEEWDLSALLEPPDVTLATPPDSDDESTSGEGCIVLFPHRKPVMEISVASVIPFLVAVFELHTMEVAAEEERQKAEAEEEERNIHASQLASLEDAEKTARAEVATEAANLSSFKEESARERQVLIERAHEAAVQASLAKERSASPMPGKSPTLDTAIKSPSVLKRSASPLLGMAAPTPHEMHKLMKKKEAEEEAEKQRHLAAVLVIPISEEETQRAVVTRIHEEEMQELEALFGRENDVLMAKQEAIEKAETEALLAKVETKITEVPSVLSAPVQEEPDVSSAAVLAASSEPMNAEQEEHSDKEGKDSMEKQNAKRRKQLTKELNAWKKRYEEEHGKPPTKKNIKADPHIAAVHEEYQALKKKKANTTPEEKPVEDPKTKQQETPQQSEDPAEYEVPPKVLQKGWQSVGDVGKTRYDDDEDAGEEKDDKGEGKEKDAQEVKQADDVVREMEEEPAEQKQIQEVGQIQEEVEQIQEKQKQEMEEVQEKQQVQEELKQEEVEQIQEKQKQEMEEVHEKQQVQEEPKQEEVEQIKQEMEEVQEKQQVREEPMQEEKQAAEQVVRIQEEKNKEQLCDRNELSEPLDSPTAEGEASPKTKGRKATLVSQLNEWKAAYTEKHGVAPSKKDIKADPSIAPIYEEYDQLNSKKSKEPKEKKPKQVSRKKEVVKELNTWKAQFESVHGKPPTKKDLANSEIRELYQEYQQIMKAGKEAKQQQE